MLLEEKIKKFENISKNDFFEKLLQSVVTSYSNSRIYMEKKDVEGLILLTEKFYQEPAFIKCVICDLLCVKTIKQTQEDCSKIKNFHNKTIKEQQFIQEAACVSYEYLKNKDIPNYYSLCVLTAIDCVKENEIILLRAVLHKNMSWIATVNNYYEYMKKDFLLDTSDFNPVKEIILNYQEKNNLTENIVTAKKNKSIHKI